MSHVYSFFLHACILLFLDKWLDQRKNRDLYLLSFLFGLIVLLRPTEGLIILLFPFYKVNSIKSLKERGLFFIKRIKSILIGALLSFAVVLPQFVYWKISTGEWLFFSYTNNEGFFFTDSKIIEGLFSYRKGWLVYAPIMLFSLLGLIVCKREMRKYTLAISLFFLASIYVIFSWWSWWYGGSYGMRSLIGLHAVMAFPMAMFLDFLTSKSKVLYGFVCVVFIGLISLSVFQNYQYRIGLIHYEAMTKETYWGVFLKEKYYPGYSDDLKVPDYEAAKMGDRDL